MSLNTKIEWCEATWNPVAGCTRVSDGCDSCYAVRQSYRLERMGQAKYAGLTVLNNRGDRHFNGKVRWVPEAFDVPKRRRKPTVYFVNSMSDLFHGGLYGQGHSDATWNGDFSMEGFTRLLDVWHTMRETPQHTYQICTKRPRIMADMVPRVMAKLNMDRPLPNVWLLTSCENQVVADERIPHLLRTPAAVRGLSCEPLLGAIDLGKAAQGPATGDQRPGAEPPMAGGRSPVPSLDWVISGGESGKDARPSHVDWHRSLRDQCAAAGVAYFFKQWGSWAPPSEVESPYGKKECYVDSRTGSFERCASRYDGGACDCMPTEASMVAVNKWTDPKTLDSVEHHGYPGALREIGDLKAQISEGEAVEAAR